MNVKHNRPSLQGMTVETATMIFQQPYRVQIETSEDGFEDLQTWTLNVDRNGIRWESAHYWLRQVIDWDLEQRILYFIGIYDDDQPF